MLSFDVLVFGIWQAEVILRAYICFESIFLCVIVVVETEWKDLTVQHMQFGASLSEEVGGGGITLMTLKGHKQDQKEMKSWKNFIFLIM